MKFYESGEHVKVHLHAGQDSYALISLEEKVNKAVCFFHGFVGHPHKTWLDFQGLVDDIYQSDPWWIQSDLFFFGYESFHDHIATNSQEFLDFIRSIFPAPARNGVFNLGREMRGGVSVERELPDELVHGYKELVLVGHSEGGLVLRDCVLSLTKEFDTELNKAYRAGRKGNQVKRELREFAKYAALNGSLRLFAPALMGASPSSFWATGLDLFSFIRTVLNTSPAYGEMKPGSSVLNNIQRQTEAFSKQYGFDALRAKVLWARDEGIVSIGEYQCDTRVRILSDRTHISVCKPTRSYLHPIEFVEHGYIVLS